MKNSVFATIFMAACLFSSINANAATLSWVNTPGVASSSAADTTNPFIISSSVQVGLNGAVAGSFVYDFIFDADNVRVDFADGGIYPANVLRVRNLGGWINTATLSSVGAPDLTTLALGKTVEVVWNAVLAPGIYTIHLEGTLNNHLDVTVAGSEVPLPAAIWLFGSALMGLVGFSRLKTNSAVTA